MTTNRGRRPRGAVRDALIAAGIELARAGGPEAVVLREATRIVGVVPNTAYRHFADRDELMAAVSYAAMAELGEHMAAEVARLRGGHGNPEVAAHYLGSIGAAYLRFARNEPGLFATAHALPHQHAYPVGGHSPEPDHSPLGQVRAVLDALVEAGALDPESRPGLEYPIWSTLHGLAVLTGAGPLRDSPDTDIRDLEELTLNFIGDSIAFLSRTPLSTALGDS